jgi:hypothetical protein
MVGDPVTVRSHLSPMSGQAGRIAEITPTDLYGPYLVWFDGGLQFRYQRRELALTNIDKSARTDR